MKPKVKFCGMTRIGDINEAEKLNVDFIGFIFARTSPRKISLEEAKQMKDSVHQAKTVGIFTDNPTDEIERLDRELDLDFIQLHGDPDVDQVIKLSKPVIQAFCGVPDVSELEAFLKHCPYILIDKVEGQNEADFDAIASLPQHITSRLFLAGGLTPGNVRSAVDRIRPYAVDCARGIESTPGKKNLHRMFAFFQALS